MEEFMLGGIVGAASTIIVFMILGLMPRFQFTEYKIKHGCAYYDTITGKLVDREKCIEKTEGEIK